MADERRPMILHTRVVCGAGGGPEKTILHSPAFLAPLGYDAVCVYMHPPGDPGFEELSRRAEELGAPLIGVEDRGAWDLRVPKRLLALCREHRVAVWHGHDYKSNALGLLLHRFWPMRLASTVHGWGVLGGRRSLYYKIDRLCLRRYERVICVSDDLREQCLRAGTPADRCVVIDNGIDCRRFRRQAATSEAKRRLGFDSARLLVGSVGRLSSEKGFDGLIRAVDRLARGGADVALAIAGEGDQRARLEALTAELDCRDRVHLLGYRSDTIELYQAMDVFVLNSLREGLPNVVLEAMAMEVPLLATRIAGVPKLVEHETNGLLIDPGDSDRLVTELGRLLKDADLRASLAAAARKTVEQKYSFAARMEKIRDIYDQLLGGLSQDG